MSHDFTNTEIAGITFKLSFDQIKALPSLIQDYHTEVAVARDYHNHYDKNAISVFLEIAEKDNPKNVFKHLQLGYVPKEIAADIAKNNEKIDALTRYNLKLSQGVIDNSLKGNSKDWVRIGNKLPKDNIPVNSKMKNSEVPKPKITEIGWDFFN